MPNDKTQEVTFLVDHQIGSKLLSNFYRTIVYQFKEPILSLIINDNIAISNEIINHTKSKSIPQLLFRGTRDGFNAIDFHSKCDNQGPTLTIIKSAEHNQVFGGFTTQSWISSSLGDFIADSSAFIFKIENSNNGDGNSNQLFRKFNIKQDKTQCAIYSRPGGLPTFGGSDIYIGNNCNSYSCFGYCYKLPPHIKIGSEPAKTYLAGSYYFTVSEIEVFKIIIQ